MPRQGMAQRISIVSFMLSATLLRFNYNSRFFPYSSGDLSDDQ